MPAPRVILFFLFIGFLLAITYSVLRWLIAASIKKYKAYIEIKQKLSVKKADVDIKDMQKEADKELKKYSES
jgi:hypothetical protein